MLKSCGQLSTGEHVNDSEFEKPVGSNHSDLGATILLNEDARILLHHRLQEREGEYGRRRFVLASN